MKPTFYWIPIILLAFLTFFNFGRDLKQAPQTIAPEMNLKVYEVGDAISAARALNQTFRVDKGIPWGRAEIMPNGNLAVATTQKIHEDIAHLVLNDAFESNRLSIQFDGKVFLVVPGEEGSEEYRELVDQFQFTVAEGDRSKGRGSLFQWWIEPQAAGDMIRCQIQLEGPSDMATTLLLKSGHTTTVGQVGISMERLSGIEWLNKEILDRKGAYLVFIFKAESHKE